MKPILFNTEMVKAILEGRKTVTRRIFNPKYKDDEGGFQIIRRTDGSFLRVEKLDAEFESSVFPDGTERWVKPPYEVGDVLYVRETWRVAEAGYPPRHCTIEYKAGGSEKFDEIIETPTVKWKPSIHMPKEAARLFLRVKKVDIQRLNDMQEEDAIREGFEKPFTDDCTSAGPLFRFSVLWDSTIKPADIKSLGWDANPFVWVIEFERCEKSKEN